MAVIRQELHEAAEKLGVAIENLNQWHHIYKIQPSGRESGAKTLNQ